MAATQLLQQKKLNPPVVNMEEQKQHWNNIYSTKQPHEVSWTQKEPQTSLAFIDAANLKKDASIIDVGGGDSLLVDHLLNKGYENITVLDISETALQRAKNRLGEKAKQVTWVACDITEYKPREQYDFWHDRAAFHFLTTTSQIEKYLDTARTHIKHQGIITIGTFSTSGPQKCSGLFIKQYDEELLSQQLHNGFKKIKCIIEDHITPFNTKQNFLFCSFKRTLISTNIH